MDFTCVEIKNVKYVKLINLDRKCEKELDLTTIHRDQELAYLNIYYVDENKKKQLLKSIQVNHIRPGKSGIPELHLIVNFDGDRYYKIVLKLNGYIFHSSVVDMKPFRRKKAFIPPWLWVAAAVIVVAGLLYFPLKGLLSGGSLRSGSQTDFALRDTSDDTASGDRDSESNKTTTQDSRRSEESAGRTASDSAQASDTASPETASAQETASTQDSSASRESSATSEEPDGAVDDTREEAVSEKATAADRSERDRETAEAADDGDADTETSQGASASSGDETAETESSPMEKPPAQLIDDEAIVYFYPDSTVLTPDAKAVLNEIVDILKKNVSLDVEIIGHCAFFGTEKGRQEISDERARNVYNYFISRGWLPESEPVIEGKGHREIVTRDPDKQNLNRRVEIRIKSL